MIQQIIKNMSRPPDADDNKDVVNIIFCDNNLLLTKQTSERIDREIGTVVEINHEIYIEFSSHSRTPYKSVGLVCDGITRQNIYNILCCTNGTRVDDIYKIINTMNENKYTKGRLDFKIWLDEADKYINYIDYTFIPLINKFDNVTLFCITATSKKLFEHYGALNVFPIENTTCKNYHGWEDNEIIKIDISLEGTEFVRYVMENVENVQPLQPGSKWFIPAGFKKSQHIEICDICNEHGFAVIIVNGDGIKLIFPDKRIYEYKKDRQLNDTLKKIYTQQSLVKYPLAITGCVCIGRGISIMSEEFMIDYAILSVCSNPQEASQNAGRVKGNIKGWKQYKPPKVYTTPKFDNIAREWEKKSRGLAKLAYDRELQGKSTIITKQEYKTVGERYKYIRHHKLFDTYKEAIVFLKQNYRKMKCKSIGSKKGALIEIDGFWVSTRLIKASETKESLTAEHRLTFDKADKIYNGFGISSTEKGQRYLVLPVYESMNSLPNSVKFQVRYISFSN
ncbi:MAG: hypothetical protein CMH58_10330 [Myxococcales bacterium]|nr:hypothetical protein [Myxococcales bacterium]